VGRFRTGLLAVKLPLLCLHGVKGLLLKVVMSLVDSALGRIDRLMIVVHTHLPCSRCLSACDDPSLASDGRGKC